MITTQTRRLLARRSGGICEVCHRVPATNAHHRKARGMGGTTRDIHTVEWLLHVCGMGGSAGCHGLIENNPTKAHTFGMILRGTETPTDTPVRLARGLVYLTHDGGYRKVEPVNDNRGW